MNPQQSIWDVVHTALELELENLNQKSYKVSDRQFENVTKAFSLIDNRFTGHKGEDRYHVREYFLGVISSQKLFILSALAGGKALIRLYKEEPEFLASEALKWIATVVAPAKLDALVEFFFAGRRKYRTLAPKLQLT